MDWTQITELDQLEGIDLASQERPVLILKHSTRCSVSSTARDRLERDWTAENNAAHPTYFLDLLRYREISNAIAERYNVMHESPQTLVIHNGKCVEVASHFGITYADTLEALKN